MIRCSTKASKNTEKHAGFKSCGINIYIKQKQFCKTVNETFHHDHDKVTNKRLKKVLKLQGARPLSFAAGPLRLTEK